MKNPLTPAGIEPATFRFVAQHLNHCATAVPVLSVCNCKIFLLSRRFIFGGSSLIWINTFPLRRCVLFGGGVVLGYSRPAFG